MPNSIKTAFITGATSGIGEAAAEKFYKQGWNIIITGRRSERLERIKNKLLSDSKPEEQNIEKNQTITTLTFDVRNLNEVETAIGGLSNEQKIDLLINNAGLARGYDNFDQALLSDWEEMIDSNVKGLIYVSRAILPRMIEQGFGHIINIGSTAAKEVYPRGNIYCATKHAVDALTKAMRIDLIDKNIKIGSIHPGYVETEFSIVRFHGDEQRAKSVYNGFRPLTGNDVAEVIFFMANAPWHMNIADLVLLPSAQASAGVTHKSN